MSCNVLHRKKKSQGKKQTVVSRNVLFGKQSHKERNKQKHRAKYYLEKSQKERNKQKHRTIYYLEKKSQQKEQTEASCSVLCTILKKNHNKRNKQTHRAVYYIEKVTRKGKKEALRSVLDLYRKKVTRKETNRRIVQYIM